MKHGIERLSGYALDDIQVHYNSSKPQQIGAAAFAQGSSIHLGVGQERHLPHEAWHLVQQRQGRVRSTLQMKGAAINDDDALEREADIMGARAAGVPFRPETDAEPTARGMDHEGVVQRVKENLNPHNSKHWPVAATRPAKVMVLGSVTYLVDAKGKHWTWGAHKTWVARKVTTVPLHSRFTAGKTGRGGARAGSLYMTKGSGASYFPKRPTAAVKISETKEATYQLGAKRTYRSNMKEATKAEGIETDSATVYAAHFGAPHINGGYNWCHLMGHGAGGSDSAVNIVAASTHANSEQLQIERVYYRYRKKGISFRATAKLRAGTHHLADSITCEVFLGSISVLHREISGVRASKPSYSELKSVEMGLLKNIAGLTGQKARMRF